MSNYTPNYTHCIAMAMSHVCDEYATDIARVRVQTTLTNDDPLYMRVVVDVSTIDAIIYRVTIDPFNDDIIVDCDELCDEMRSSIDECVAHNLIENAHVDIHNAITSYMHDARVSITRKSRENDACVARIIIHDDARNRERHFDVLICDHHWRPHYDEIA